MSGNAQPTSTSISTPGTIPATQKSWRALRSGKPADVLELAETPVPSKLKKGEVLIKVQAAALNPV